MFDVNKIRQETNYLKEQANNLDNKILGMDIGDFIFSKIVNKIDPIQYCETILRNHLPENRKHLHENQIELVKACCNPKIRKVGGLMARQAGKTESIASITGYLLDNYPNMRIGIFTPRVQQAEINLGRTAIFYQMNEERLNNKIIKCNKQRIELSNGSFAMAVSGSDQSNIEGLTFDVIILDEAQKISDYTWSERIFPMGGATNAKLIKIGTPKTRNHFYKSIEGEESKSWCVIRRDWTQCAQLWVNAPIILPDHTDPEHLRERPYSKYVIEAMPKTLKQEYFPTRPDVWELGGGGMSIEDFKTQYMLEFVDGVGKFLLKEEWDMLVSGDFDWIEHGTIGEKYYAGIDFAGADSDGSDFTHITIIRKNPNGCKQKVWATEFHGVSYPDQMKRISNILGGFTPRFKCEKIFADYTGCGRPIVQTLQETYKLDNLIGITFNSADTFTRSGMNMKNIMYSTFKNDLTRGFFQYPSKEKYFSNPENDRTFYHKMVGEWNDLESQVMVSVNKRIQAPAGQHDDCCSADILANFAANYGGKSTMPRAGKANIYRR